jgi:hypothetical protein
MELKIRESRSQMPRSNVCAEHRPAFAESLPRPVVSDALRRDAARRNLAPSDAEWNEYFGDD